MRWGWLLAALVGGAAAWWWLSREKPKAVRLDGLDPGNPRHRKILDFEEMWL